MAAETSSTSQMILEEIREEYVANIASLLTTCGVFFFVAYPIPKMYRTEAVQQ
jgi:hypothetical protein